MTWLTWRQHRQQGAAMTAALAVLAAALAVLHHQMTGFISTTGLAACLRSGAACTDLRGLFSDHFDPVMSMLGYLNLLPLALGLFWGAPLIAGEVERGTHRLAWTQSVPRGRWVAVKLAVLGSLAAVTGAAVSLLLAWGTRPVAVATGPVRMRPDWFDLSGIAPVGYALFAFALGTAAGALTRRTLTAMAVTIGGFLAVRLPLADQRWRLLPPLHRIVPTTAATRQTGDWILPSSGWVDSHGQALSNSGISALCPQDNAGLMGCLAGHGVHRLEVFEPAARFWALQSAEFTIYVSLAAVLLAIACWSALRRTG